MIYYEIFSPKLNMWYNESYEEKNINIKNKKIDYSYAIYPKRFYKNIDNRIEKKFDFCFIGTLHIDNETFINRKWILPFIEKHFTNESYLQFTDKKTKSKYDKLKYNKLGNYDKTLDKKGFVPKEQPLENRNFFDEEYFLNMCKSKFCLCPAGDLMYSMRFYEALMCRTIPIVNTIDETFRSKEESMLDYKYYLASEESFIYREDWAEHNYNIFLKYHTLEFFNVDDANT